MTIFYRACIVWYLQWRIRLLISYERDDYIAVNVRTDLETRDPLQLKDSAIDFSLYVMDTNFDNDDNSYGEFKLHMFSSMDEGTKDIVVPLKTDCGRADEEGSPFHVKILYNILQTRNN